MTLKATITLTNAPPKADDSILSQFADPPVSIVRVTVGDKTVEREIGPDSTEKSAPE